MLKRKLDKQAFEALHEALKEYYVESDGGYTLQAEPDEEIGALKRGKDREAQTVTELKQQLKELKAKLEETDNMDARKRGDIETLEKAWKDKNEKMQSEYEARLSTKDQFIKNTLVDNVASALASELFTVPKAVLPYLKSRLSADLDGESPTTRVLDETGKPSASSIDDLKKELLANKEFSAIIVGSKATGGGASKDGKQTSAGGADFNANSQSKSFRDMTVAERKDFVTAKIATNKEG
jgi:TolA-binding protein